MTLSKVHQLVNLAIKNKFNTKEGLLNPNKSWNQGEQMSRDLACGIADYLDNDLNWLNAIKKQLPPIPKCKHREELHDRCGNKLYCMGCNEDLS